MLSELSFFLLPAHCQAQIMLSHAAVVGLAAQLELQWPPAVDAVLGTLGTASSPVGGLMSFDCALETVFPDVPVVFTKALLVAAAPVLLLFVLVGIVQLWATWAAKHGPPTTPESHRNRLRELRMICLVVVMCTLRMLCACRVLPLGVSFPYR